MPTIHQKDENPYFIDPEAATEMARLMKLDQLTTRSMGGLFPELPANADLHDILDIACGPGSWVLDVAYEYAHANVTGIDISQLMVEYASAQAKARGIHNASFQVMDAMKPLEFPDNSFDLVNARFLFGFMPEETWPSFVRECVRIAHPGGIVRLIECEPPITNSPAYEKVMAIFNEAMKHSGKNFSPDARHLCLTPMLSRFLQKAGCTDIHKTAFVIDWSAGEEAHHGWYENYRIAFRLLLPFFLKTGVTNEEDFEPLYNQMVAEMLMDNFSAIFYFLSAWSVKPA